MTYLHDTLIWRECQSDLTDSLVLEAYRLSTSSNSLLVTPLVTAIAIK